MSSLWIAAVLIATPPGDLTSGTPDTPAITTSSAATVGQEPLVALRTGPELRDVVRAALRRWARPEDKEADVAAREFLVLYDELQQDTRLAISQRDEFRNKVRGRLMILSAQINKRMAIERRLARSKRPASVDPGDRAQPLAQWGGGMQRGGMMGGGMQQGPMMGGPMMGGGVGGGPVNDDHGQDLVELIQQTISPTTWDVNGGPGSIYYWRPGRAIVVRQMGEIHDQIGGVLEQMGKIDR